MNNLQEKINELLDLYQEIKREIRVTDKHLYEQWKAGGFLVDDDIMSMYPSLPKIAEILEEKENEDEYDEDNDDKNE